MLEDALRLLIEEMPFAINSLTLKNFKTNNLKIFILDIKKLQTLMNTIFVLVTGLKKDLMETVHDFSLDQHSSAH